MSTLKWFTLYAILGYGALLALLYLTQRAIQYFPERFRTAPAAAGLPQAQEVVLETSDGERVIAWHVMARGDKPDTELRTAVLVDTARVPYARECPLENWVKVPA